MVDFLELSCSYQTYSWGKRGLDSEVVKLKENDATFKLNPDETYSELWVGTHAKGPSTIIYPVSLKGTPLSSWIRENQGSLGNRVAELFKGNLPFLFKVLSINKALSIQAHPTKDHAQMLHSSHPQYYPDPNHKPEMVIALNTFEGMCGFRRLTELQTFVLSIPELQNVLGTSVTDTLRDDLSTKSTEELQIILKTSFTALMNQEDSIVKEELKKLRDRFEECNFTGVAPETVELFKRLYSWYPGDVGCWCSFFLNYFKLEEGQSLFLAPNEPHAYIAGDVVECMSCSDNVVRAGLTPKYKDKDTLCSMLTYTMSTPAETLFHSKPHPLLKAAVIYDPPTSEFTVTKITCCGSVLIPAVDGPSVFLIYYGCGTIRCGSTIQSYSKGSVYFVPADKCVTFDTNSNAVIFHAYCQL